MFLMAVFQLEITVFDRMVKVLGRNFTVQVNTSKFQLVLSYGQVQFLNFFSPCPYVSAALWFPAPSTFFRTNQFLLGLVIFRFTCPMDQLPPKTFSYTANTYIQTQYISEVYSKAYWWWFRELHLFYSSVEFMGT